MKSMNLKSSLVAAALLLLTVQVPAATATDSYQDMRKVFASPQDVQTSCYWYWISGNISKEGVINDLKSMKKAGINRAFIGFQGIAEMPHGPVYMQSDEWYDIVHAALKTATEENIEIGIFNGPGWSQAGGPWVDPKQSMRYLASQHALVTGGGERDIVFPHPDNFLQNVKVLAFKRNNIAPDIRATVDHITTEGVTDVARMFDGDLNTTGGFERDKASITVRPSKKDFTLRSIRIESATPIRAYFSVKVKRNGAFEEVCSFGADRTVLKNEVGYDGLAPTAVAVPETRGEEFMVEMNINANCKIKEFKLSETPIVDRYADKILSKMHQTPQPMWHDYKWDNRVSYAPDAVVSERDIIDITDHIDADRVVWNVPEGDWEIVRTYMAPTGICNAPAIKGDGEGPEVDRWNRENLKHHYDSFIGEILRRVPENDRKTWKMIVCDSYEKATQNYGDDFIDYFKSHFGYDPTPYLLTFDGIVVGSTDKSDRFLWDLRRMIADRLAYDHIGGMRELAHKDGFGIWLESYGHWGFPGEFLQYGGQSDEVAGEFWSEGSLGDIENRAASSAAHIYGKGKVSSESFTCGGPEFARSPRHMKQRGDKFFTEGINNTLLHLYVSQPDETSFPGLNCWFGNEFNRKNTWYSHIDLFTDYLKRCNYLLQQGNYVADVAYYIGEDVPVMTGITEPALPKGFQYDFINAEVIENYLSANEEHILSLPHGTRYKLLVLPPSKTMRPGVIRKIKRLLEEGAIILGPKPERSPSLQDYMEADAEVKAIADELWGNSNSQTIRRIGKGWLFAGYSIEDIFGMMGYMPDFRISIDSDVKYAHTTQRDRDIYFVSNQTEKDIEFTAQFRIGGKVPELWSPMDGSVRTLKSFVNVGNVTHIPMRLYPNESAFIVFDKDISGEPQVLDMALNYPETKVLSVINDNWNLTLKSMVNDGKKLKPEALKDLSTMDDDYVKYFSGTAVYTNSFKIKEIPAGKRVILDLGEVYEMAKVKVNGKYAGGVWTAPYTLDITDVLKRGKNSIEISVVNNWVNRLVGDSRVPEEKRKTSYVCRTYRPKSPLQKSGLTGPVRILTE